MLRWFRERFTVGRVALAAIAALALLVGAGTAWASHLFSDMAGHTTLEHVVTGGNPRTSYSTLCSAPVHRSVPGARRRRGGQPRASPTPSPGARPRRRSLAYFGQMTDFQLADEESPARVEFTDQEPSGFAASAWRPQEALQPFVIDWSIRQMNLFVPRQPGRAGRRHRARDGLRADHRRPGRQHAAQRDAWVRGPARGRHDSNSNSGSTEPGRLGPAGASELRRLHADARAPRRGARSTPACRTTTTTTRARTPTSTTPTTCGATGRRRAGPRTRA